MRGRAVEPALFLLLGAVWGSAYLAIKVGGSAMGPFEFVALRLLIGAVVLTAAAVILREPLPARGQLGHIVVVGLTGLVVPFLLISWAQRDIDAGLASIFNAATPLFTVALAAVALSDEPLRARRLVGIVIGLAGVIVVVGGGIAGGGAPAAIGAMVLAVASYAVTAVWTRRFLRGARPLGVAAGQVVVGLVVTAPAALIVEGSSLSVPAGPAVGALLWLGVMASGVAPLIFFRLIGAWGASRTSLVNYLIPLVGVAAGAIALGERIELPTLVGGAVVVAGIAIANRNGAVPADTGPARSRTPSLPVAASAG